MADLLRLVALQGGLLLLIAEDASGLRLDSYRPVESRVGVATRNAPPQKPTAAFALRRFATAEEIGEALQVELMK